LEYFRFQGIIREKRDYDRERERGEGGGEEEGREF